MRAKRRLDRSVVSALLACCFLLAPVTVAAEKGYKDISTHDLKAMMDKGENFYLVNVLPRIIHDIRHIEGSLNIPIGKVMTSPEMPRDKSKPIVFYCLGPG